MKVMHSARKLTCAFTVSVTVVKGSTQSTWTVTCQACGQDLSADYSVQPVVLQLKNDVTPQQMAQFRNQWAKAIEHSSWKTPIIMDSSVELVTPHGVILQEVLAQHVAVCKGESK